MKTAVDCLRTRAQYMAYRQFPILRKALRTICAKDFEKTIESAEAWPLIASIQLLTRRIARP